MSGISRRRLLQAGISAGMVGTLPQLFSSVAGGSSPTLEKFVQSLPIPEPRQPDGRRRGALSHTISIEEFSQNLHPALGATTLWGYDGQYPGPLIEAKHNQRLAVRFDNSELPSEHLFAVDERIGGTTAENHPGYDGSEPVPAVRTVTHFHGLSVAPEHDGQSDMWHSPDGQTGPRRTAEWQELPMNQHRLTSTYHDHTLGIVRLNAYAGLVGLVALTGHRESKLGLPAGEYDIPLLIQDKSFNEDGSLSYPERWTPQFAGDTAVVNGAVWPSLEVEPRRYRFRLLNGANHRTFGLRLASESGIGVPPLYQFAPDQGYLESVVPIGPGGDLETLVLQPFERGEVIVDFASFAGETLVLKNVAELPYRGEHSGSDLEELLQIRVTDPTSPPHDPSIDPQRLTLPTHQTPQSADATRTRSMDLGVSVADGLVTYQLNGYGFGNADGVVRPQRDTTEIWELQNTTSGSHPIHLHLVTFRVIGRGPDGTDPPDPNERGHKDTVRVAPNETVRIAVRFDGYTGQFPWHCHMLEHEDNKMMLRFEVTDDEETGNGNGHGNGRGNGHQKGRGNGHDNGRGNGHGKGHNNV
ncbi:multicopper oxidase family protein [Halocatena halophila]|uniref:multicopper oxidase family protein n=1 Tax=Halocatena halophila TaxID=2814576 RepID=UPI002ED485E7